MPAGVTIRPARAADLPQVARLAAALVRLHHAFDPERFMTFEPIEPAYQAYLAGELRARRSVVLVAARRTKIIGYAYGRLEKTDWNDLRASCGKLHDVYVADDARGGGVASALVLAMVARLEGLGAPRVVLITASKNRPAQRLFRRLGFRPTALELAREAAPSPPRRPRRRRA